MWNNLSLTEHKISTLIIDNSKLSIPNNALVGRLAMKKYVSIFEHEKGLRSIWDIPNCMETTLLGNNLYMFTFVDARTCKRIYDKQPWNFRGSLILLDRLCGDECPTEVALHSVPFWVQAHGLQIRAMNKTVREELGALLGTVLEVRENAEGATIGR